MLTIGVVESWEASLAALRVAFWLGLIGAGVTGFLIGLWVGIWLGRGLEFDEWKRRLWILRVDISKDREGNATASVVYPGSTSGRAGESRLEVFPQTVRGVPEGKEGKVIL